MMPDACAEHGEPRPAGFSAAPSAAEYAEQALVLAMLAREHAQDDAPVLTALAQHGFDAALGVLTQTVGAGVRDAYLRRRARWRAAQAAALRVAASVEVGA
ncbi:hypothetical protein [Novosphingobium soli]